MADMDHLNGTNVQVATAAKRAACSTGTAADPVAPVPTLPSSPRSPPQPQLQPRLLPNATEPGDPRPNAVRKPCRRLEESSVTIMSFSRNNTQSTASTSESNTSGGSSSNNNNHQSRMKTRCCYAVDTEMVTITGPEVSLPAQRAMVSVGVVNERLETILYGRVAVPQGCEVIDGAFARAEGGLWAGWDEGMPATCVSDFLARHAAEGGVLVGWEIHGDLDVAGFAKAAERVRNGDRENLPLDLNGPMRGGALDAESGDGGERPDDHNHQIAAPTSTSSAAQRVSLPDSPTDETLIGQNGQQEGIFREETVPEDPRRFCSIKQQAAGDLREREASTLGSEMGSKTGSGEMSPPRENALEKRSEKADSPGMEPGVLVAGAERCADTRNEGKEEARTMKVTMKVVEVTDLFRTMKGHKCTLGEAYACCFDRTEKGAHNAANDACMTMELYNLWKRAGQPEQPLGLPLWFFVVNFHSFKSSRWRQEMLWNLLRPEGGGSGTGSGSGRGTRGTRRQNYLEKDSGTNTYKLSFRDERERDAYLAVVETRMAAAGLKWKDNREFVRGKRGSGDGYQLSCAMFKMHVLEHER